MNIVFDKVKTATEEAQHHFTQNVRVGQKKWTKFQKTKKETLNSNKENKRRKIIQQPIQFKNFWITVHAKKYAHAF